MKRSVVMAMALMSVIGCKKGLDNLEKQGYDSGTPTNSSSNSGPYSGGGNPTAGGAAQAVRGAAQRTVTAAELHDLHLFMTQAKLAAGRVPTYAETWQALNQPDGNRKIVQMIQEGILIMVNNPQDEGLWAYAKEAPTQGGWILTHNGAERVTAQDFASRFGQN
jgi:hypothetical protein